MHIDHDCKGCISECICRSHLTASRTSQPGVTLIELMITLFIMAVLLTFALPAFTELLAESRLKAATSALYLKLYQARSEAIKRNQRMRVTFMVSDGGATWCYGMKTDAACDCTVAGSCQIDGAEKTVNSTEFPGVGIDLHISAPGDHFTFENIRWITAGTFGHVRFNMADGGQTRIIVSRMGRVRLCSPAGSGNIAGYSSIC